MFEEKKIWRGVIGWDSRSACRRIMRVPQRKELKIKMVRQQKNQGVSERAVRGEDLRLKCLNFPAASSQNRGVNYVS